MKYFFDENLHVQIPSIMEALAPSHSFSNARMERLAGYDDVDLIPEVASRGFDALVTNDIRQMMVPEEILAIRQSGMHWISVAKASIPGLHGLSAVTATLVAAMPHLLDIHDENSSAQRIKLMGRGRERQQILRHEPL